MSLKRRETSSQQHTPPKRKLRDKRDYGEQQHSESNEAPELQRKLRDSEERIINLQIRNRALLDELDDLRTSAAADADQAQKTILHLARRYAVLQEDAERNMLEKADMNDVMKILIEKIEQCNADFSAWTPTRLRMSRSLSIVPQGSTVNASDPCTCPRAFEPALVAELSQHLACEREAHAQTLLAAEQRVAHYEAAIARREAELASFLEACQCKAASLFAISTNKRSYLQLAPETKVESALAVDVNTIRREVDTEKTRNARRQRTADPLHDPETIVLSPKHCQPPPSSSTRNAAEPDLVALTRLIDSLRIDIQRLSSEKAALQRIAQAEFSNKGIVPSDQPCTNNNRESELRIENERLREALARAQHQPSSPHSQSIPSPAIHPSSVFPSTDLFRSPPSNASTINTIFPPLTPDYSITAASTSIHGYSPYDNVESMFPVDVSEEALLPLSPLLSPLQFLAGSSHSQSHLDETTSVILTPLNISGSSSESSDDDIEQESPTLRAAELLRQQREADLQAQLAMERLGSDLREREMQDLREAISSLALGPDVVAPESPSRSDIAPSDPG